MKIYSDKVSVMCLGICEFCYYYYRRPNLTNWLLGICDCIHNESDFALPVSAGHRCDFWMHYNRFGKPKWVMDLEKRFSLDLLEE